MKYKYFVIVEGDNMKSLKASKAFYIVTLLSASDSVKNPEWFDP